MIGDEAGLDVDRLAMAIELAGGSPMTAHEEGRAVWVTRDRAEEAETRVKELEARVHEAMSILRFHNQTATGLRIECLEGCVACAYISSRPLVSRLPSR